MKKSILITGGCGFIGHHLVEHVLKNTNWDIVILDKLSYASGGLDRLRDIDVFSTKRVSVFTADFTLPIKSYLAKEIGEVDYIAHLGASTHVDNSIKDPEPFVMDNVVGTMRVLDFAKTRKKLKAFVCWGTDEVFGPAPQGVLYKEADRFNPTNPYAATKSGAEMLAQSYANCYGLPVIVTSTMNVLAERQSPEKFFPGVVKKVLTGQTVIIHADKTRARSGSRFYIHARNAAAALLFLLDKVNFNDGFYYEDEEGYPQYRHRYNIVGEKEMTNLELAQFVADVIGKPLYYELVDFHSSRPGHDLRYSLDGSKLASMGFSYPKTFEESIEKCVRWMLDNPKWLEI